MASSDCHLLALPAELRNSIWLLAVIHRSPTQHRHHTPKTIVGGSEPYEDRDILVIAPRAAHHSKARNGRLSVQPAITRTDRQIRREALAMFYVGNTFKISFANAGSVETALRWLACLGPHATHLRKLHALDTLYADMLSTFTVNSPPTASAPLLEVAHGWNLQHVIAAGIGKARRKKQKRKERSLQRQIDFMIRSALLSGAKSFDKHEWAQLFCFLMFNSD